MEFEEKPPSKVQLNQLKLRWNMLDSLLEKFMTNHEEMSHLYLSNKIGAHSEDYIYLEAIRPQGKMV
jgi:hypothetical protein